MDIVDIYMECGDFHTAVRQSGLPVHVAHLQLLKAGCLKIQDKINFGTKGAKLGAQAEEKFQQLVPQAIDANHFFKKNNPVYDFCVKNLTIDVKFSSLHVGQKRQKAPHWAIRCSGEQDFLCAFLEREQDDKLNDPIILLIPNQFVTNKDKIHISKDSYWIKKFELEAEELAPLLNEYAELKEQGII